MKISEFIRLLSKNGCEIEDHGKSIIGGIARSQASRICCHAMGLKN
jgi:hypothetical protein